MLPPSAIMPSTSLARTAFFLRLGQPIAVHEFFGIRDKSVAHIRPVKRVTHLVQPIAFHRHATVKNGGAFDMGVMVKVIDIH